MTADKRKESENGNSRRMPFMMALAGWLFTSLVMIAIYWHVERPGLRLWTGIDTHGNPARRAVALTFDDGPDPLWAPLLADSLQRHGALGTFFLVGVDAQRYPEITERLVKAGNQIGNHSMTHPYPNLTAFPHKAIVSEIRVAGKVLTQITGQHIQYFRPPGGGVNDDILATLQADHLRMAWWSTNVGDWSEPPPPVIVSRLHAVLRPGVIVLMHERGNSVAALESFLADKGRADYTYTTFSSLLRQ